MKTWKTLVMCSFEHGWQTYKDTLERAIVNLRDEDFDAKAGCNDSTKRQGSNESERDLQQLSLEPLRRGEKPDLFACDGICDGLLVLKLPPLDVDLRDALDSPSNAEVNLLLFPVLSKDCAPHCAHNAVDGREGSK